MALEATLRDAFVAAHPSDTARIVESMPLEDAAELLAESPTAAVTELLRNLTPLTSARALELLQVEVAARLLDGARRDVAGAILRTMDPDRRSKVMAALPSDALRSLQRLLRYAEGTAGALMDPRVLVMGENASVQDALQRLSANPQHSLYYLYVVTEEQKLEAVVNVRELILARPEQMVGLIAARPVEALSARASWESVSVHPAWERFHALPVVESDGRFLGVLRYESVLEFRRRMRGVAIEDRDSKTAGAVGELYGLGLRGLFEWATLTLLGPTDSDGGPR